MESTEKFINDWKATLQSEKIQLDNLDWARLVFNEEGEVVVENEHGTQFPVDELSEIEMEILHENPAFLSKFGEGFVCTDVDNFQFGKEISDNKFRFVEINRGTLYDIFRSNNLQEIDHFELIESADWYDEVIDLEDYTELDIDRIISGYYDSVEAMKEIYGEPLYKFIIAECIFEYETQY